MLLARRRFLDRGYYDLLANAVASAVAEHTPEGGAVLDAGCGEGYYTQRIRDALLSAGKKAEVYAFDISKDAVKMTASRMEKKGHFFVASTFHIPVKQASFSVVTSLFAPYSEEEFLRVLKPGGILIRAVPLEDHLYELKCAVYDAPTKNEKKAEIGSDFTLLEERRIRGKITLSSSEEIGALFGMTPYAHKTGKGDRKKLSGLSFLETTLDFGLVFYRKDGVGERVL